MEIIPAIDLRGGKCVRLYQGDYNQETVFSEDPVDTAKHWQSLGARRIHIVDLDGAAKRRDLSFCRDIIHSGRGNDTGTGRRRHKNGGVN